MGTEKEDGIILAFVIDLFILAIGLILCFFSESLIWKALVVVMLIDLIIKIVRGRINLIRR